MHDRLDGRGAVDELEPLQLGAGLCRGHDGRLCRRMLRRPVVVIGAGEGWCVAWTVPLTLDVLLGLGILVEEGLLTR